MNLDSLVSKTPLIATIIFGICDASQVLRMYTEQTSAGQSLWGWIGIFFALGMYATFFKIKTPKEKLAFWCTVVNMLAITGIILTVVYFRYL